MYNLKRILKFIPRCQNSPTGEIFLGKGFKDNIPPLLALILFLYICFGLPSLYPRYFAGKEDTVGVVILPGTSARAAAGIIVSAGITSDSDMLVRWMIRFGIDRTLKPGLYKLNRGNAIDVALQMKRTTPIVGNLTLIPGMRYWKIAETIYGSADAVDKLNAEIMKDENFPAPIREKLPQRASDRMAFILPETYYIVPEADKGAQVIKRAAHLWWERMGKYLPENVAPTQLMALATLASIVEGEAKAAEERPILAGIFLRRIDKRMMLQSCATVIYCWELKGIKKSALTYKDLEINSPYNTYKNDGLPPGPISIPSEASWRSVLNPQDTPYLFFFASSDGSHIFSRTYEEHLKQQRGGAAQ